MNPIGATVVIVGAGARTAVGATAPATAAAVRAGVAGFGEHPFMVDAAGNRMIVAAAPYLSVDAAGSERLVALATEAAREAVAGVEAVRPAVAVYVGLPPPRPGRPQDAAPAVAREIRQSLSGFQVARYESIETGHAAGAVAIHRGWEAVRSGAVEFALAGGVDSYLEPETLEWLEGNEQLHSAGPENNPYGFIPGEAAGFVLLGSAAAADRHRLAAGLELATAATARETKLIKTDAVCTGEGLTALFRALAGDPPSRRADHLYCDLNGEPYRSNEFGYATIRAGGLFRDPSAFTAPADCWGDVGAASGPLLLMLMDTGVRKGYAAGSTLAAFASSESGERSGFVAVARPAKGVS